MKQKILFTLLLVLAGSATVVAQDQADFAQLLRSETDASMLLAKLREYKQAAPWDEEVVNLAARRLAVMGLNGGEIIATLRGSGNAAAAIDTTDAEFGAIVIEMGRIRSEKRDTALHLYALRQLGVPVFDLLGEAIGKSPEETERLGIQGKLRGSKVFEALLAFYKLRYDGMEAKLAKRRAKQ